MVENNENESKDSAAVALGRFGGLKGAKKMKLRTLDNRELDSVWREA